MLRFKQELWKLIQRGSSIIRNMFVGAMFIILILCGVIVFAMLQDLTQEDALLILSLAGTTGSACIGFIIYAIWEYDTYKKIRRRRYEALTEEELKEIAMDLLNISKSSPITWGKERIYSHMVILGKPFTESFSWLHYKDIVWAYEGRETYPWSFHRNSSHTKNCLILRDDLGNGYKIDCDKVYYKDELEIIKQRAPRCRIGYSRSRNKVYKMEPATFHYKHDL